MYQEGRGSAVVVSMVVAMLCIAVVLEGNTAEAGTFTVGDSGGWTFNVAGWPKGKRFRAGDTLVFKYDSTIHNVVVVDKEGYKGCSKAGRARSYQTGNDQIKLIKGQNYFICTLPGHCQSGMKINATTA